MSPAAIAAKAASLGIQAAAITDHNSALNCRAFNVCCRKYGILPVFGIEVTSMEEAHILTLFETVEQAEELGRIIYERLPDIRKSPSKFGDQVYVDSCDNILGEVDKYLITAADISMDELFILTADLYGMFIPAHIDKPVFSIPSQLGFLPPMDYTALETTVLPCPVETLNHPLIRNSDAHYLDDIGCRYSALESDNLSFEGIKRAICNNYISFPDL